MKRRITILLLVIVLVVFIFSYKQGNDKTFMQNGITYAVKLDGVSVNYFPDNNLLYRVDVSCDNAKGKWLYDEWKLAIEKITGNITCSVEFNTIEKILFNNYIISLLGTDQGDGKVVDEKGYRYEGKNPNNYVWFNNELWRIIGVFGSESHGQNGKNLVKIIRANSIGGLAWNKSNVNDWTTSSLKLLLNGAYYNALDGTESVYCYGYSTIVPANCDYREIGIQENYRGMVENVTWYLGGWSTNAATAEAFYGYERGETVYGSNPASVEAQIGLMYPSDYGYSVLSSGSCERTTNLGPYGSDACAGQSWLYGQGKEWALTPYSSNSSNVFNVHFFGNLGGSVADYGYAVRPVLYLKSSVYVMDGDGSMSDPYIIT